MATITITYTPVAPFADAKATEQIFSVWNPAKTASDNAKFNNTYYQTNVWDNGEFAYATSLDAFLAQQVAHPGLIAALRAAVRAEDHSYAWEATDDDVAAEYEKQSISKNYFRSVQTFRNNMWGNRRYCKKNKLERFWEM